MIVVSSFRASNPGLEPQINYSKSKTECFKS